MPRLCREDALAYTPDYAEFQEGRTIVNVRFPGHGERSMWLARASIAFDATWNELPHIVAFATAHLRVKQRERWRRYDEAGITGTLAVHGSGSTSRTARPTAMFPTIPTCASRAACRR